MSVSTLNDESIKQVNRSNEVEDARIHRECPTSELSDLVDIYAVAAYLPTADWVTRLNLVRPRRDVRCLSATTRFFKRSLDIGVSLT
ncbi:MAG: hypothetical protein O3B86_05415, partial [Planctomycetota bacterium]|nr:hypothetical protein [Planctomycetota bacterium]